MSTIAVGVKRRWAVAGIVAIGVVAGLMMLVRLPEVPRPVAPPAKPAIQVAPKDELNEQTTMHDLEPLFLPTRFNATLAERDLPRREPGQSFLDSAILPPTLGTADMNLQRNLPPVTTLNGKLLSELQPLDSLTLDRTAGLALGIGRTPVQLEGFKPRGGVIEATSLRTGGRFWSATLPAEAAPPTENAWQPVQFLVATDAAGLVGPPTLVPPGSGVEKVDNYLRDFLAKTYRIGERLAPGFYRISIAP